MSHLAVRVRHWLSFRGLPVAICLETNQLRAWPNMPSIYLSIDLKDTEHGQRPTEAVTEDNSRANVVRQQASPSHVARVTITWHVAQWRTGQRLSLIHISEPTRQ